MIRNENAHALYTTSFMSTLFAEEGKGLFDVRQAILGHLQQGGDPTPFDRILATRLAATAIEFLIVEAGKTYQAAVCMGLQAGQVQLIASKICHAWPISPRNGPKNNGG